MIHLRQSHPCKAFLPMDGNDGMAQLQRDAEIFQTLNDVSLQAAGIGHQLRNHFHLRPFHRHSPRHDQTDIPGTEDHHLTSGHPALHIDQPLGGSCRIDSCRAVSRQIQRSPRTLPAAHCQDHGLRLNLKKLKMDKVILGHILQIGLPAGFQGIVFSLSNVLIQSSINSFGSTVMAGSAAANNIENFVYQAMNAFYQTNLTFTGQNYGAGDCKRVDKSLFYCQGFVILTGLILGNLAYFFGHPLVSIYNSDEAVIQQGIIRLGYIARTYALCGIMDTMVGSLRGLGYSIVPMVVSLIGACGLRIVWIFTIFQMDRTPENLYISYPISWIVTGAVHILYFLYVRRKAFALIKTDSHVAAEGRHPAAKV